MYEKLFYGWALLNCKDVTVPTNNLKIEQIIIGAYSLVFEESIEAQAAKTQVGKDCEHFRCRSPSK